MRFSQVFHGKAEDQSRHRTKSKTKSVKFDVPLAVDTKSQKSCHAYGSEIEPPQLITVFKSIDIRERTGSNESPTSVRDIEGIEIGEMGGSEISCAEGIEEYRKDDQGSHSYIFAALDRILIGIAEEETGGVEVDEFGPDPFDSLGPCIPRTCASTDVFEQNETVDASLVVSSSDIGIFTMGLVGHGHTSIPATIAKKSLERHLEYVLSTISVQQSVASNMTEREQIEIMAREVIEQKNFGKGISLYKFLDQSKGPRSQSEVTRTLANLIVLNTLVGKERSSMIYAKRSLRMHRTQMNKYGASISLFLLGVVYFRFGRVEKALRTWSEALQILILVFGYDHAYVAMLLNNLGCLQYIQGDFVRSMQLFSESLDINRKVLGSSSWDADSTILDISMTKGNIAMILARNGKFEAAWSLLEEVLSLQECVSSEGAQILVSETKVAMRRVDDRITTSTTHSTTASANFFGSKSELSELAAVETVDTFTRIHVEQTRMSIFGSGDGIPMRRNGTKSPIDVIDGSDNLDTILLGPLENEYTSKQRVRAAVLCWFDKTLQEDERDPRLPFVPFQTTPRKRARIPIDLDTNEAINAELHLKEINEQALDCLEVRVVISRGSHACLFGQSDLTWFLVVTLA